MRLSYQVLLLQPYSTNLTSRVVKSPKVYWADLGLLRQATRQWETERGELFETAVVVEVHKWVSTLARDVALTFYRTTSGLEVDLIVETGWTFTVAARELRAAGADAVLPLALATPK